MAVEFVVGINIGYCFLTAENCVGLETDFTHAIRNISCHDVCSKVISINDLVIYFTSIYTSLRSLLSIRLCCTWQCYYFSLDLTCLCSHLCFFTTSSPSEYFPFGDDDDDSIPSYAVTTSDGGYWRRQRRHSHWKLISMKQQSEDQWRVDWRDKFQSTGWSDKRVDRASSAGLCAIAAAAAAIDCCWRTCSSTPAGAFVFRTQPIRHCYSYLQIIQLHSSSIYLPVAP